VRPSRGTVGDCYDNALCESFFATLECELLDRRTFRSQAEARPPSFASSRAGTTRIAGTTPSGTCHPLPSNGFTPMRLETQIANRPRNRVNSSQSESLRLDML